MKLVLINTNHLLIRNFTVDDWKNLYDIAQNYEASEYAKYDHGPWPDSPDAYKNILKSMLIAGLDYDRTCRKIY